MNEIHTLINCPICGYGNHFSPAGNKIVACGKCGAPVYNADRRSSPSDIKDYQDRLEIWGQAHRKTSASKIDAYAASNAERKVEKTEIAKLNDQCAILTGELEKYKEQYQLLHKEYVSMSQKNISLQADIEAEKMRCEGLKKKYHSFELKVKELTEEIQTVGTKIDTYIYESIEESKKSWNKLKKIKVEIDNSTLKSLQDLKEKTPEHNGTIEQAEKEFDQEINIEARKVSDSKNKTVSSEKLSEIKDASIVQPVVNKTQAVDESSVENSELPKKTPVINKAIEVPIWLKAYNMLGHASSNIQSFKSSYEPKRLTIKKDVLEQHRTTLSDSMPVFTETVNSSGSYWLIQGGGNYFLVLNRERFSFNSANYRSIAVCYNFNDLKESDLKYFNDDEYELNRYEIVQPAEVIPDENTGEWKMHGRGRIVFTKKPQSDD